MTNELLAAWIAGGSALSLDIDTCFSLDVTCDAVFGSIEATKKLYAELSADNRA